MLFWGGQAEDEKNWQLKLQKLRNLSNASLINDTGCNDTYIWTIADLEAMTFLWKYNMIADVVMVDIWHAFHHRC